MVGPGRRSELGKTKLEGVVPVGYRKGKGRKGKFLFIYLFVLKCFLKKKSGVVGFVFFMYLLDLNYSKLIGRLKFLSD